MLLNNPCKSINGDKQIMEAILAPIYTILEMIRIKIMNRWEIRRLEMVKWFGEIGPRVFEIMEVNEKNMCELISLSGKG